MERDEELEAAVTLLAGAVPDLLAAVRTVLDQHKPHPDEGMGYHGDGYGLIGTVCATCGTPDEYGTPWPCGTYRAIEAALGEGDHP